MISHVNYTLKTLSAIARDPGLSSTEKLTRTLDLLLIFLTAATTTRITNIISTNNTSKSGTTIAAATFACESV